MSSFLQSVAQRLFDNHGRNLGNTLVVFNNRRAGLFLQNEMSKMESAPFFMPQIVGMNDLVNMLGNIEIAQQEFLLFELFRIHREHNAGERKFDSFEEFVSFGEMMISDFSEIDLYCVDAERLFNNIYERQRLGEWDVSGKKLTPSQQRYLNFYRSLFDYYSLLRNALSAKSKAYTGMAYRNVAENIDSLAPTLHYDHIYFVGFNALSVSEQRIINFFIKEGLATLICDGDDYYFSDNDQEAGFFLREHAKIYDNIGPFENNFSIGEKEITIVNCPENTMQAKAAGNIIGQIAKLPEVEDGLQNCAVVLSDETLLLPMLNSLPDCVKYTNVTMGFPYTLTNTHNLANAVLYLYAHVRNNRFYHTDLSALFNDPVIARISGNPSFSYSVGKYFNDNKIIYASTDDIIHIAESIPGFEKLTFLFEDPTPSVNSILDTMLRLASVIIQSNCFENNPKEKEALACYVQIFNHFKDLQKEYEAIAKTDTLQRFYQRIASRHPIAFYGKPLQGLQILGTLETRSLDFPYIVMTSVNEGIVPSGRSSSSLIPHTLAKAFGLPSFEEKDAVYAYNFYRLLQRAKKIWLLYNSNTEGLGKGEPSRFILQLRNELAVRCPSVKITETTVTLTSEDRQYNILKSIPKSTAALNALDAMATKGFSPTAINSYRSCPLKFYFSEIVGVKNPNELSDDVESNELGTLIHAILCDIYNRDTDKRIRIDTLSNALGEIDQLVDQCMDTDLLKGREHEGRNHLYGEVAKMQLKHFLKNEIATLQQGHSIHMVLSEERLSHPIEINNKHVNILGFADRIDLFDGQLRIADYKSGGVYDKDLRVKDEHPDPLTVPEKWFQVLCYAWLYCRTHDHNAPLLSGLFPLRTLDSGFVPALWTDHTTLSSSDIDNFESLLVSVLTEILDPGIDFYPKPEENTCAYCPVAKSCTYFIPRSKKR